MRAKLSTSKCLKTVKEYDPIITLNKPIISVCSNEKSFHSKAYIITDIKQSSVSQALLTELIANSAIPLGFRDSNRTKCFSEGWQWTPKLRAPCLFLFYWVCQQHSTLLSCETKIWEMYFHVSKVIFLLVYFMKSCMLICLLWSTWMRNDSSILSISLLLIIENI